MSRKKLIFATLIMFALALAITSISYGYWTDNMNISGEGTFEYHLPIINDIKIPEEEPADILIFDGELGTPFLDDENTIGEEKLLVEEDDPPELQ